MADLREFFREIQRVEYFHSILARLSIQELEKITVHFDDQMKEILIGEKFDCWRHKVFLHAGYVKNILISQSKLQVINFDKFVGFSNDQTKMMISFLQCITKNHDYALQVH